MASPAGTCSPAVSVAKPHRLLLPRPDWSLPSNHCIPSLRYGLSQALLTAVAQEQGIGIAEVIAREYGLPRPTAVVPLLAQLDTNRPLESLPQPSSHIAALSYTVPAGDPAEISGQKRRHLTTFSPYSKGEGAGDAWLG